MKNAGKISGYFQVLQFYLAAFLNKYPAELPGKLFLRNCNFSRVYFRCTVYLGFWSHFLQ